MQINLREYQDKAVTDIRKEYKNKIKSTLFALPTGGGKCLAKGTDVLMFDGRIKKVENVKQNDLLMGPDSEPRKVVSTCVGYENMYTITPIKGEPFTVNESHILSFKISGNKNVYCGPKKFKGGDIANVTVLEYINSNKTFKHCAKIWRTGVEFKNNYNLILDPYFLGLWLGDGCHSTTQICTNNEDVETVNYLHDFASKNDMRVFESFNSENSKTYSLRDNMHRGRGGNTLLNKLKKLDVYKNKHIPEQYKTASRNDRFQLLAGLLDADGSLSKNGFDFVSVSENICDDVIYLSRSLGLAANKQKCTKRIKSLGFEGQYYRTYISGDTHIIPTKVKRKQAGKRKQQKSVLVTGVKSIECIGVGDYYGFELSGNNSLFLLGDFTVTHNTFIFSYITKLTTENNKRVLILVHRVELLRQASKSLKALGIEHGLISPKYTPNPTALVQVASVQTLIRRMDKVPAPSLIIIDECHHTIAGSWRKVIDYYSRARILGVTATPCRTDNKPLSDVFDTMVQGPQIYDLIEMGFLVKPVVYGCANPVDLGSVRIKGNDYDKDEVAELLDRPKIIGSAVEHYTKLCPHEPCVVFCVSVKHAENVAEEFRQAGYIARSVDGAMDDNERSYILDGLGNGNVEVVTSCDLISEGTDIPAIKCAILLRPTHSESLFIQQVGRALRKSKGKTEAIILDHVGNCARHGLPDSHRDWTLEGKKKITRKRADEAVEKAKQCEACYQVYEPAPECPYCGHKNAPTKRELEQIEGELKLLTEKNMKKQKRMEVGRANSLEELQRIGRERGYKPGWAFGQWQRKVKKKFG